MLTSAGFLNRRYGTSMCVSLNKPLCAISLANSDRSFSLDCTAGAGTIPTLLGVEALKRKGGTLQFQGEDVPEFPNFPMGKVGNKYITIKAARGHNFESCELALKQLNSDRFPLDLITTHRYGLKDTHDAINAVGGSGEVIHVSLMPWE